MGHRPLPRTTRAAAATPRSKLAELTLVAEPGRVASLLSPLRRRLLTRLQEAPDSAAGLARRFALPRQRLNYHLRELERAGFLELAATRPRRGCTERILRTTARAWLISPEVVGEGPPDPKAVHDRLSSHYLLATAARMARDVVALGAGATRAGKRLATFTLETVVRFKSAADRAAFSEELADAVARLAAKYHDESAGSRAFRFVLGGHPVPRPVPASANTATDAADAGASHDRPDRSEGRDPQP